MVYIFQYSEHQKRHWILKIVDLEIPTEMADAV